MGQKQWFLVLRDYWNARNQETNSAHFGSKSVARIQDCRMNRYKAVNDRQQSPGGIQIAIQMEFRQCLLKANLSRTKFVRIRSCSKYQWNTNSNCLLTFGNQLLILRLANLSHILSMLDRLGSPVQGLYPQTHRRMVTGCSRRWWRELFRFLSKLEVEPSKNDQKLKCQRWNRCLAVTTTCNLLNRIHHTRN